MKHLAAYLLLHLTHPSPTKEDVTNLLATVGIQPDIERLDQLYKLLEGRDINEVISVQTAQEVNCSCWKRGVRNLRARLWLVVVVRPRTLRRGMWSLLDKKGRRKKFLRRRRMTTRRFGFPSIPSNKMTDI